MCVCVHVRVRARAFAHVTQGKKMKERKWNVVWEKANARIYRKSYRKWMCPCGFCRWVHLAFVWLEIKCAYFVWERVDARMWLLCDLTHSYV